MNLTKKQLAQNADAMNAAIAGQPVQYKMHAEDKWCEAPQDSVTGLLWNCDQFAYRPKPQPVSRPWSKPEDVPLHCWLRSAPLSDQSWLVNGVLNAGVYSAGGMKNWNELRDYEYSTDRKTWKPCTVEDAQ
jgi:hypothetical protein